MVMANGCAEWAARGHNGVPRYSRGRLHIGRAWKMWHLLFVVLLVIGGLPPALGASYGDGKAALIRHDYQAAARIFKSLAVRGDPRSQAMLGFLYAHGRGVPQSHSEAAKWYLRASEQGNPTAQYMLGLMYDKGHGVRQDYVEAYKWLNLAVAGASEGEREYWVKIRDAVASKLSSTELRIGQNRALKWEATRGR